MKQLKFCANTIMKWLILKHLTLQPQGDPNFIDKIFNVIKVKAFNNNFNGFVDELKKSDDNINQLTRSSAKFGGVLTKNTDLTKVSGENLIGQRRAIRAENEARKEQIKVLEGQIATYKKEHPEQKTTIRQLESELKKLQNFTES